MKGVKKSTWIGGTAFLAVLLLAMTWFVLVAPVRAQADDTREQIRTTEAANAVLQAKVNKLKADFVNLDAYKDDVAALQKEIPTKAQISSYLLQLDAIAVKHEVSIVDVQTLPAQAVTYADPAAGTGASTEVQPTAAPSATPSPTPSPSPSASAAPAVRPGKGKEAPGGFSAIPVTFKVVGAYSDVLDFLDAAQHTKRLLLVQMFTETAQTKSDASGGRPATAEGDSELEVGGFIWVLPGTPTDVAASGDGDGDGASGGKTKLPKPPADKNPLVPVDGPKEPTKQSD